MLHIISDHFTILAFTGLIKNIPAGSSFSAKDLAGFLHEWTVSPRDYTKLETEVNEMLVVLYHMGLLSCVDNRYIMTESGEKFFGGKKLPLDDSMSDFFTIQPNFEIIVGPEIKPAIRFKIERVEAVGRR